MAWAGGFDDRLWRRTYLRVALIRNIFAPVGLGVCDGDHGLSVMKNGVFPLNVSRGNRLTLEA